MKNVLTDHWSSFFVFLWIFDINNEIEKYPEDTSLHCEKGIQKKRKVKSFMNLGRRKVAPESKFPIGVWDMDTVKLISSAYWLCLYVFLLPMYLRRRRWRITAAVKARGDDSGFMFRVGSWWLDVTECCTNVVEKHFFLYLIFLGVLCRLFSYFY